MLFTCLVSARFGSNFQNEYLILSTNNALIFHMDTLFLREPGLGEMAFSSRTITGILFILRG